MRPAIREIRAVSEQLEAIGERIEGAGYPDEIKAQADSIAARHSRRLRELAPRATRVACVLLEGW